MCGMGLNYRIAMRNLKKGKNIRLKIPLKRAREQINLITVNYDNIANVHSMSECKQLLTDYSDNFNSELVSLHEQMYLQID